MNRYYCYFMILLLFISCRSLKTTQINSTTAYVQVAMGVSKVPADIYKRLYSLRNESQTLQLSNYLATTSDTKESVSYLEQDFESQLEFMSLSREYATAYRIVEEYGTLVLSLLNPEYHKQFVTTRQLWQTGFDKLVQRYNSLANQQMPAALSGFTKHLVSEVGRLSFGNLQRKYLITTLEKAEEPLLIICNTYLEIDSLKITNEMSALPRNLQTNFADFLTNARATAAEGNDPLMFYKQYIPVYQDWLTRLQDIKVIAEKQLMIIKKLRDSYANLRQIVSGNGNAADEAAIVDLANSYNQLIESYRFIDKRDTYLETEQLLRP